MTLFLLIWIALVASAVAVAVGALWGRASSEGACAGKALAVHSSLVCGGCVRRDSTRPATTPCGVSPQ